MKSKVTKIKSLERKIEGWLFMSWGGLHPSFILICSMSGWPSFLRWIRFRGSTGLGFPQEQPYITDAIYPISFIQQENLILGTKGFPIWLSSIVRAWCKWWLMEVRWSHWIRQLIFFYHPQSKIELGLKYLYECSVCFPVHCLSGAQWDVRC